MARLSTRLAFIENAAPRLTAATNHYLLQYNHTDRKFDLVSPDDLIEKAVDDGVLPENYITQLEQQIDVNAVTQLNYDGGSF